MLLGLLSTVFSWTVQDLEGFVGLVKFAFGSEWVTYNWLLLCQDFAMNVIKETHESWENLIKMNKENTQSLAW